MYPPQISGTSIDKNTASKLMCEPFWILGQTNQCGKVLVTIRESEHEFISIPDTNNFDTSKSIILHNQLNSKLKAFLACLLRISKMKVTNSTWPLLTQATTIPYQLTCSMKEQQTYQWPEQTKSKSLQKNYIFQIKKQKGVISQSLLPSTDTAESTIHWTSGSSSDMTKLIPGGKKKKNLILLLNWLETQEKQRCAAPEIKHAQKCFYLV